MAGKFNYLMSIIYAKWKRNVPHVKFSIMAVNVNKCWISRWENDRRGSGDTIGGTRRCKRMHQLWRWEQVLKHCDACHSSAVGLWCFYFYQPISIQCSLPPPSLSTVIMESNELHSMWAVFIEKSDYYKYSLFTKCRCKSKYSFYSGL